MNATPPKDELLERYAQAKAALPDGLPSEPSAALRERILASAREQVSAIKNVAPLSVSTPSTTLKSIKESEEKKTTPTEAANNSFWNIRAFASIAVMGLAGLLWWQFEQGTPEEQLAAKSAQPSAAAAKVEVAAPPTPAAPAPAPATSAPATSTADALIAPAPQSQAKIMAKKSAPLFDSEKSAAQKESAITPAPESARVRTEEAAPAIAATPSPAPAPAAAPAAAPSPAPAPAPAARAAQQSSKAAADGLANTAPAPSADNTAAQNSQVPPPQARAAFPAAPRAAAPMPPTAAPMPPAAVSIPPAAAPAPSAPPSSAFTRANFIAAIFAKDALTLRQALAQGVSPNVMTPAGNPALTQAVIERWPEGVRILLAAGADRNSKNSKGHTAADVALELGFEDMSRLLEAPR